MKLALGPCVYYWDKLKLLDFYESIQSEPVDIVYLGETICSKRRILKFEEWLEIGQQLEAAGKQVVLSTLTLITAESELKALRRQCENHQFLVEANDMAAVHLLAGKVPFVTGPSVNIYNIQTLSFLVKQGLQRWVLPVELSKQDLQAVLENGPDSIESEVFVYGKLPLAYSARCYTARSYNLPKDDCQFRCMDDLEGLSLYTTEDEPFLTLNGIQTQSSLIYNLLDQISVMKTMGVDVIRVSPQFNGTEVVLRAFDRVRKGGLVSPELSDALNILPRYGTCNGFWHQQEGMSLI